MLPPATAVFGPPVAFTIPMTTTTKAGQQDQDEEEWRRLCELVAHEPDPRRLSILLDQLIQKLDARTEALRKSREQLKPPEDDPS